MKGRGIGGILTRKVKTLPWPLLLVFLLLTVGISMIEKIRKENDYGITLKLNYGSERTGKERIDE